MPAKTRWPNSATTACCRARARSWISTRSRFFVISETADVLYKCTDVFAPGDEYGILWSDPDIGIEWPCVDPILSAKDGNHPRLADAPAEVLFEYQG